MLIVFENAELDGLYHYGKNPGKPKYSDTVIKKFSVRIQQMEAAPNTHELRKIKSLHFEKLAGHLSGKYSIRVQDGYRIIFSIGRDVLKVEEIHVEDMNNHDYRNKS